MHKNVCCALVFYVFSLLFCVFVCVGATKSLCSWTWHGAHKLDLSTLFATFFLIMLVDILIVDLNLFLVALVKLEEINKKLL